MFYFDRPRGTFLGAFHSVYSGEWLVRGLIVQVKQFSSQIRSIHSHPEVSTDILLLRDSLTRCTATMNN